MSLKLLLGELIKVTKVKNPSSKISLATNRSDEQKLNLKVNTVNSLINELSFEEDCNFYISDNGSLGNNGLVHAKFVADDGYHLSDDGVRFLLLTCVKLWSRYLIY